MDHRLGKSSWYLPLSALVVLALFWAGTGRPPAEAQAPTLTPAASLPIVIRAAGLATATPTPDIPATATPTASATATPTLTPTPTSTTGRPCIPAAPATGPVTVRSCNSFVYESQVVVVGEIENGLSQTIEDVRLAVTFYNAANEPIGSGTIFLQENLVPGKARSPFHRAFSPPAGYGPTGRVTVGVADYNPTTRDHRRALTLVSQSAYTPTGELPATARYFVAEAENADATRREHLKAILTTYDRDGNVLNTAAQPGLVDILEPGKRGPFKVRLTGGPLDGTRAWIFLGEPRTDPAPVPPTLVGAPAASSTGGVVQVTGQVRNDTGSLMEFVSVVVTLYDGTGAILNTDVFTLLEPLGAGQQATYQVEFGENTAGWATVGVKAQSS